MVESRRHIFGKYHDPKLDKPAFYAQYWNLPMGQFYFQQTARCESAFTPCASTSYNYAAQQSITALTDYYNAYVAYLWQYMCQFPSQTVGLSANSQSVYCSQAESFEPSVSYSSSAPALSSSHSPAFCLVNGHYEISPHISYDLSQSKLAKCFEKNTRVETSNVRAQGEETSPIIDKTSVPTEDDPQAPLDIESIESDC